MADETISIDPRSGSLAYHEAGRPGKLEIRATKPVMEGKAVLFKKFGRQRSPA